MESSPALLTCGVSKMNYILIYDFGSQYTQVIAKTIRNSYVYSVVQPPTLPLESLQENPPRGVILSGGPHCIFDTGAPTLNRDVLSYIRSQKIPILGICYGMQLLMHLDGGVVEPHVSPQYGEITLEITASDDKLFKDIPYKSVVWMSHSDSITKLAPGYSITGKTNDCHITAANNIESLTWLLQFHPEVHTSQYGSHMIKNFLFEICKITPDWTSQNCKLEQIKYIRETVGKCKVLAGVSGGKDSTVAAALVHSAIGDQLIAVFIDNGLLRQNEAQDALERIRADIPGIKLDLYDASQMFLSRLKDAKTSSEIRHIIGKAYIDAFTLYAKENNLFSSESNEGDLYLMQGTIYSDRIESGKSSTNAATIQMHHNVGTLPRDLCFKLLEPLKYLFKDEVLILGEELGISNRSLKRHPFPGPSFAIRIVGPITQKNVQILREATQILEDELHSADLYDKVSQAFIVLLANVSSNSVKGDRPAAGNMTAVIRCVDTTDFMTCSWSRLPLEFLARVSTRITNEISDICRVTYDITNKPPATVEWL
ncbi:GMP synthase (glutamine-hydrolysing) [Babesia microti strain RI]|uniref:GMP synthase (glutamine-hydrolyzing) n=1 Tax=Babesia microti (strain RI) TaxID=1133968 RepID=A0A0K3APN7_BABMR|nr:GMP synthase (glutamine-hydrolysing) [Babesia microti strain RI]CTQ41432.1 GMP synthase (glutamine-hydrolysing) [Babesia microti strain RI]|eukprot:XP_012649443.1 GMP synthase (glutamine-hydrolysing) [Babesia microti strain RI]